MAVKRSKKFSWCVSIGFHAVLIGLLFFSLEKTILVPSTPAPSTQPPVIDAVMVNTKALQQERSRLKAIEQQKRDQEREREEVLAQKEQQAKEKQAQEEAQLVALKEEKVLQQKQLEAQQAKLKEEQAALKKVQKEKETLLVEKKKIEKESKTLAAKKAQAKKAQAEKVQAEKVQAEKAEQDAKVEPVPESEAEEAPVASNAAPKQEAISTHASLIQSKINQNWRKPIGFDLTGFKCKIAVKLMPTGDVMDVQILQSSGSLEFDRSAEVAVRKASPFPMPEDPRVANDLRDFSFTFKQPEAV